MEIEPIEPNPVCVGPPLEEPEPARPTPVWAWRKRTRWIRRVVSRTILGLAISYGVIVLVGLVPVNNDFVEDPQGVEIFVSSSAVHADVVLPLRTSEVDWRSAFPEECFRGSTRGLTHVAFGWGDRGFFLETPQWSDLTVANAANALFWTSSAAMHVDFTRPEYLGEATRSVHISRAQYRALVDFIDATFARDDQGRRRQIAGTGYADSDAFFEALGSYSCLNTCNSWVGSALREAGVRTPWLTPLPKTVLLYLPD
ncbi:MAG: TIGR02117 family protein [Planctomycetota bacterium]